MLIPPTFKPWFASNKKPGMGASYTRDTPNSLRSLRGSSVLDHRKQPGSWCPMAGVGPGPMAWPRLDVNQKFAKSGKPSRKQPKHDYHWNYHDLDVPGVPNHPATSTFQGQSCQSCQSWRFWQLPCSRFSCDRWRVLLLTAKVGNEESKDWVESMKSEWCDIVIIIIIIIFFFWYAQYAY